MSRIVIAGGRDALTDRLAESLARGRGIESRGVLEAGGDHRSLADGPGAVVYQAERGGRAGPDSGAAAAFCERAAGAGIRQLILLSSAAVNEPSNHHPGFTAEDRLRKNPENQVARRWLALEQQARGALAGSAVTLTILRPAAVPVAGGRDAFSRLFAGRLAFTPPGFDPSLQLLSPEDLARAIACAVEKNSAGTYNVAPAGVIPLRRALRLCGVRRLPVPCQLRRLGRGLARHAPADELEYLRYPWTVSGEKIRRELGFEPRHTSARAVANLRSPRAPASVDSGSGGAGLAPTSPDSEESYDDFGLDREYIAQKGRTLFRFLHDFYWRVEWRGLEHVPQGKAVLAGVHRGHQPWDGVMALHLLVRELGRYPRFLIHPTLVKFPFLAPLMIKCGGVHACRENADWVLSRDQLLAIFPEGINGAFTYYRDAYKLGRFGRNDFVKIALRHRAPIVPFVTVGSAEIFPIYGKLNWRWWKRYSEWPCFPITPTMSLLPLPSKWHTRFLEPIHVEEHHGPEAAGDPAVVRAISRQVRTRMEEAIAGMLRRREFVFWGSLFADGDADENAGDRAALEDSSSQNRSAGS